MSNSIEKAAQRLEQLRQAGAQMPAAPAASSSPVSTPEPAFVPEPIRVQPATEAVSPSRPRAAMPVGSKAVKLDFERLTAAGFVTPTAPRSMVADQFRVIKRPLIDNATGKAASVVQCGNLIMVTSSMPGEGKSFTAVNLALSMAMEMDHTVMLVDADVARPSIMKVLGLPPGPGLLDLLVDDKLEMSQVLLRTNIENLTLLPSGSPHAQATELLASAAMTDLVDDMG